MTSAVEAGTGARQGERTSTALLAAAGITLLMLRLLTPGRPSAGMLLAAIYLILGTISLAVPIATNEQHALDAPVVVAIGVVALAAASLVAGPRTPLAHGPEALALSSLAATSEEAFFRRFLFGRLIRYGPLAAVGISALLFAVVHVPAYGVAVFWVDLGAGLLLSWQRWASGGWAAPATTHVAANILAVIR